MMDIADVHPIQRQPPVRRHIERKHREPKNWSPHRLRKEILPHRANHAQFAAIRRSRRLQQGKMSKRPPPAHKPVEPQNWSPHRLHKEILPHRVNHSQLAAIRRGRRLQEIEASKRDTLVVSTRDALVVSTKRAGAPVAKKGQVQKQAHKSSIAPPVET